MEPEPLDRVVSDSIELGIFTFAETALDASGAQLGAEAGIRNLLEEIELADQVGLDLFGGGEHHRPDYAVSSPAIVMAAGAAHTNRGDVWRSWLDGDRSLSRSRSLDRTSRMPPYTRVRFDAERELSGALFVGSPEEVIEKILFQYELFGHERFMLQLTVGPMPHVVVMRAIELFGTEVAPVVQRETGRSREILTDGSVER